MTELPSIPQRADWHLLVDLLDLTSGLPSAPPLDDGLDTLIGRRRPVSLRWNRAAPPPQFPHRSPVASFPDTF